MTATEATPLPRGERELILATRDYVAEDTARSWYFVLSTFGLLAVVAAATALVPGWPAKLALGALQGLLVLRGFILFHDFQHGAILRKSKVAEGLFWVFGLLVQTPASVWKETHNYHHAHTAKLVGSHIGSYPMVTVGMYRVMTPLQRVAYAAFRHPLNMFFAVFTVFSLGMCVLPVVRSPLKHWSALLSLGLVYGSGLAAFFTGHLELWVTLWLWPMFLASMLGAYLFFAQHNFPDIKVAARQDWTFGKAALESSSYMQMSRVMHWFTGNIGYHHVHHLNSAIPFYRLPEAMEGIPELQHPGTTTWRPADIVACLKLKLWDPEQNKMVGFP